MAARGQAVLQHHLRSLPNLIFYEGSALVLPPLMALTYTRLGVVQFIVFTLSLVFASLITRSLAQTSRRLERRVQKLGSLQAGGSGIPEDEQHGPFEKFRRARSVCGRRSGSGFYPHPTLSLTGRGL
jgi:hypothetical protein